MSVPSHRRLPERPSLEQLRKQAREHLDTLRAADPSVNLSSAQHALARKYGFESWPKLVHHVESMQPAHRMLQPAALQSDQKLMWSPGRGTDVWALNRRRRALRRPRRGRDVLRDQGSSAGLSETLRASRCRTASRRRMYTAASRRD